MGKFINFFYVLVKLSLVWVFDLSNWLIWVSSFSVVWVKFSTLLKTEETASNLELNSLRVSWEKLLLLSIAWARLSLVWLFALSNWLIWASSFSVVWVKLSTLQNIEETASKLEILDWKF